MYEHFSFRLEGQTEWIKIKDAMAGSYVSIVENPIPEPKYDYSEIPGASGAIDTTEAAGRVFFNNKTVRVVVGVAETGEKFFGMEIKPLTWIRMFKDSLSYLNGRRVQFTFSDVDENGGNVPFQVGRMTFDCNYKEHLVEFSFSEVEPFRYSGTEVQKTLIVLSNYEVTNNTDAWSYTWSGSDDCIADDHVTNFAFSLDTAGGQVVRTKYVGGASGFFAFGIKSIVGGEIWFEWTTDGVSHRSRTVAGVEPLEQQIPNASGMIRMVIIVDGSYYEWKTVNGVRRFMPTIRCDYILSNYLPLSVGEIANSVSDTFKSNTIVRPTVSLTRAEKAFIICDGVCSELNLLGAFTETNVIVPRVALPNVMADFSGSEVKSVFCVVPSAEGQSPNVVMKYRKAEVF